jgi:hypothetical protein
MSRGRERGALTSLLYTFLDDIAELEKMHVARVSGPPDGRYANLGLLQVFLIETSSVQHGLGCTLSLWQSDGSTDFVESRSRVIISLSESDSRGESPSHGGWLTSLMASDLRF